MVKKKQQTKKPIIAYISIGVIIVLALVILTFALEKENTIKRNLPSSVKPGETITVKLSVKVKDSDAYYALEEHIPTGFTVVNDGGGKTANPQKLAWVVFQDAGKTSYTYTLKAPDQQGEYNFEGTFIFNDLTNPVSINGDTSIRVG